jgi:hypothetical protein
LSPNLSIYCKITRLLAWAGVHCWLWPLTKYLERSFQSRLWHMTEQSVEMVQYLVWVIKIPHSYDDVQAVLQILAWKICTWCKAKPGPWKLPRDLYKSAEVILLLISKTVSTFTDLYSSLELHSLIDSIEIPEFLALWSVISCLHRVP